MMSTKYPTVTGKLTTTKSAMNQQISVQLLVSCRLSIQFSACFGKSLSRYTMTTRAQRHASGRRQLIRGLCFRYRRTNTDLIRRLSWLSTVGGWSSITIEWLGEFCWEAVAEELVEWMVGEYSTVDELPRNRSSSAASSEDPVAVVVIIITGMVTAADGVVGSIAGSRCVPISVITYLGHPELLNAPTSATLHMYVETGVWHGLFFYGGPPPVDWYWAGPGGVIKFNQVKFNYIQSCKTLFGWHISRWVSMTYLHAFQFRTDPLSHGSIRVPNEQRL